MRVCQGTISCYLIILRGPRVEGPSQEELCNHTAQGPHVYGLAKRQAKDDLRSSGNEGKGTIWLQISHSNLMHEITGKDKQSMKVQKPRAVTDPSVCTACVTVSWKLFTKFSRNDQKPVFRQVDAKEDTVPWFHITLYLIIPRSIRKCGKSSLH